jgi:hypothetical protein
MKHVTNSAGLYKNRVELQANFRYKIQHLSASALLCLLLASDLFLA